MTRLLAPVLCFTADEIWLAMPHGENEDARAVALNDMPEADKALTLSEEEEAHWSKVMRVRADVNKALELARAEKLIGKPLDARVTLYVSEAAEGPFAELEGEDLAPLCIVSELKIVHGAGEGVRGENFDGLTVHVEPSALPRCARCWTRRSASREMSWRGGWACPAARCGRPSSSCAARAVSPISESSSQTSSTVWQASAPSPA